MLDIFIMLVYYGLHLRVQPCENEHKYIFVERIPVKFTLSFAWADFFPKPLVNDLGILELET